MKLRNLIVKHFMSCSLQSLESIKFCYKVDVLLSVKFLFFGQALDVMFPMNIT